jgi:hypothetical protein
MTIMYCGQLECIVCNWNVLCVIVLWTIGMYCVQLECIVCNCIVDNWNILCVIVCVFK